MGKEEELVGAATPFVSVLLDGALVEIGMAGFGPGAVTG
jgi:hypothetical protein